MAQKITKDDLEKATVTLYSGQAVTVKKLNLALMERFDKDHVPPEPPMVTQEVIGGGTEEEPNYEDEGYLTELAEYNSRCMNDMLNLIILKGIEFDVPEEVREGEDIPDWEDELKMLGINVAQSGRQRKVDYAKLVMLDDTAGDLVRVMRECLILTGVDEEVVRSWTELF